MGLAVTERYRDKGLGEQLLRWALATNPYPLVPDQEREEDRHRDGPDVALDYQ